MGHTNLQGTIVYHKWSEPQGYSETERPFSTLDELFHLCMQASEGEGPRIDRIVLNGSNERGDERTIVFSFQSVTASDGTPLA
jgi:hypothetical protein